LRLGRAAPLRLCVLKILTDQPVATFFLRPLRSFAATRFDCGSVAPCLCASAFHIKPSTAPKRFGCGSAAPSLCASAFHKKPSIAPRGLVAALPRCASAFYSGASFQQSGTQRGQSMVSAA
jgi:hypothetical protein